MSTILRALKKLEQDKEAPGARDLSHTLTTAASAKGWPAGRYGSSKRWLAVVVVAAAFVGISGAAVYFYARSKPANTQASNISDADRKPVPPQATAPARHPINRPESNPAQSRQQSPPPQPARQRKPLIGKPGRNGLEGGGMQAKPVTPKPIESRERLGQGRTLPKAAPPVRAAVPRTGAGAARSARKAPSANPKSEDDAIYTNARRLTDNRIKIQAIAWSPIPDERMSVINNRIVREGDSVEGFSVVKIRSDDVIVREKGRLYRAVFGSP
jgi:hypothetical protein